MKQLGFTTIVTLGAFTALGACEEGQTPTGGTGGSGGASSSVCSVSPSIAAGSGSSRELREGVQCYVADATNGEPNCLDADDRTLVERVGDYIGSCGFAVDFVVAAAGTGHVLAECDALADCCASQTEGARAADCFDQVERSQCAAPDNPQTGFQCSEPPRVDAGVGAEASDAGGTGAGNSSRYALCCYRICGHNHCT